MQAGSITNHGTVAGEIPGGGSVGDSGTTTFPLTPLGTLQVVKQLVPPTDLGRFDLNINGVSHATAVADGGRTPAVPVVVVGAVDSTCFARASNLATRSAPWIGARTACATPPPSAIRTTSGAPATILSRA